jgi:hypothetical protein
MDIINFKFDCLDEQGLPEVIITFSDGSERWLFAATPDSLAQELLDFTLGGQDFIAIPHLLVVREIDKTLIKRSIIGLFEEGRLEESSLELERDYVHWQPCERTPDFLESWTQYR